MQFYLGLTSSLASHPCCAKFLGCCVHDQTPEIQRSTLFLKYYRRGNLWSAIEESEEFMKKRKEIEKNPKLAKKKEIEEYCGQPVPYVILSHFLFLLILRNYFDARQFCNIAMDICNGIDFLHDKNIMHRDLKPANILIDEYFNVYCLFFVFVFIFRLWSAILAIRASPLRATSA
jgi:serine/threonine protein kinase